VNGSWTQLGGAGVRIAASWDPGTYPGGINPGGYYVANAQGSIFYWSPGVGYIQFPGAAVQLAPTNSGGLFALANDGATSHAIFYYDLTGGPWTQKGGAANSIAANGNSVFATNAGGGIFQSAITGSGLTPQAATIVADASQPGIPMTRDQLGANLALYFNESASTPLAALLNGAGVGMIRWPGGDVADTYHWQTNINTENAVNGQTFCTPNYSVNSATAFDPFMLNMVKTSGFDLNITVNYGSNLACTGGGDPNEAAAWVNYANNLKGYGVKYWTVGNEQYFNALNLAAVDLNSTPHNAAFYASQVANQFYPLMKAQDPTIQVGVDIVAGTLTGNNIIPSWDQIVLANAKYDFVEMHFYPEYGPNDNDTTLLTTAPAALASYFATARSELSAAGHASTPIYLGEFDADSGGGKQTLSIVDALFTGMVLGEVAKAGIPMATVYEGVANCPNTGNVAASIYGWQTIGSWGMYSSASAYQSCSSLGPTLTPFPKARAFQVASQFVVAGERPLAITNTANLVQAYGATHGSGFAFMLFNLDQNNSTTQTLNVKNTARTSFTGTTMTYGKAQYDQSQSGVWAGPVSASLGTVSNPFSITLPPWSMTVVQLQ
jgi:hypothetical protein